MKLLKRKVLLLNQTYEPLAILPIKKVLKKLVKGSTSFYVEEWYDDVFEAANHKIKLPSVVRLSYYLNVKKASKIAVGKRNKIFSRDQYTCFYCGYAGESKELTIDHILPKSKGGDSSAYNLITSCRKCNSDKGDKTAEEYGFKIPKALLHSNINLAMLIGSAKSNPQWKKYLYIESSPEED